MAATSVRTEDNTDLVVPGETERSRHVADMLCRKHQLAWLLEFTGEVRGKRIKMPSEVLAPPLVEVCL